MPTRPQKTGNRKGKEKRIGLLSVTEGEAYSNNESHQVSFGYVRTKSGQPETQPLHPRPPPKPGRKPD